MANPHEAADVDGRLLPDGTMEWPGRARITEFKRAKDGRRYAKAVGVNDRTVVVWGRIDSTDEELRCKADAKLPPLVVEAPPVEQPKLEAKPALPEQPPVVIDIQSDAEPPVALDLPPDIEPPVAVDLPPEIEDGEPALKERASIAEAGLLAQVVAEAQRASWKQQATESQPEAEPQPNAESRPDAEPSPHPKHELAVAARSSKSGPIPQNSLAIASSAALVVACCLLAFLGVGLIAGYRPVVLTTASMSPVAPTGSLLIAQPVEPESVDVGDILVMRKPSGLVVTHRVVERSLRDGVVMVRTKGDANEDADPAPYSVVGTHHRSQWVIPSAGKALLLLRTRVFRLVIIAALAALIVHIGTNELRRLLRPQPVKNIRSVQP